MFYSPSASVCCSSFLSFSTSEESWVIRVLRNMGLFRSLGEGGGVAPRRASNSRFSCSTCTYMMYDANMYVYMQPLFTQYEAQRLFNYMHTSHFSFSYTRGQDRSFTSSTFDPISIVDTLETAYFISVYTSLYNYDHA